MLPVRASARIASRVDVEVADHAADGECARGLWIGIDELAPGRGVLGVEPTGGVGTDDAVDVVLRGVNTSDEGALECTRGFVGRGSEIAVNGNRCAALADEAQVSEPMLLLGDEEGIVRCVTNALGTLADGAGAAAGVAGLDVDAESFRDAVHEDAAAEHSLEAASGGVLVAFCGGVAGRVGENPEAAAGGKRLSGEQVACENGVVGETCSVE